MSWVKTICTDRRRRAHRSVQMSASVDADVRIGRRRCPHRSTRMATD
ncbi:hypothetical protein [Leyella stercorea]|nr:hypothetical protein [Leyella stercorea]